MAEGSVYRCATCGAPLECPEGQTTVRCVYCESDNRLVPAEVEEAQQRQQAFAQAAREADEMSSEIEAKGEELMRKYEAASSKALAEGDAEAARAAVRHFEGYIRLQYAPTLHMYKAMDPGDPQVAAGLAQIDESIDQAVRSVAESMGVTYRSSAERMRSGDLAAGDGPR